MGAGLPQSQVLEDRLNGRIIHNEGEDPHGVFAPGADQRFYFVYFPDQSCPCQSALFLIMGEVFFDRRYWGGLTADFFRSYINRSRDTGGLIMYLARRSLPSVSLATTLHPAS